VAQRAVVQTNTACEGLFRLGSFLLVSFGFLLVPPTVSVSVLAHLGEKSVTVFFGSVVGVKLKKKRPHA
jgi:putative effector of murein hydrolase LrgA (UPF0299 family)